MDTIYLHIGTHKTATTYIQNCLSANRQRLAELDFCYPVSHLRWNGHHEFAWSFGIDHPERKIFLGSNEMWEDLLHEWKVSGCRKMLLSSEDFEFIQKKKMIRDLFDGFNVKIIVYLRRQDLYFDSEFSQHLKMYSSRFHHSISDFYFQHNFIPRFGYYQFLNQWAGFFGKENLIVRAFEPKLFSGGMFHEFISSLGVQSFGEVIEPDACDNNFSLSPLKREVLRRFNRFDMTPERHAQIIARLSDIDPDVSFGQCVIDTVELTNVKRKGLLGVYMRSNELVGKEYMSKRDGKLFTDHFSADPKEKVVLREDLDEAVFATMAMLV